MSDYASFVRLGERTIGSVSGNARPRTVHGVVEMLHPAGRTLCGIRFVQGTGRYDRNLGAEPITCTNCAKIVRRVSEDAIRRMKQGR